MYTSLYYLTAEERRQMKEQATFDNNSSSTLADDGTSTTLQPGHVVCIIILALWLALRTPALGFFMRCFGGACTDAFAQQ
jgi:hypothetical protein